MSAVKTLNEDLLKGMKSGTWVAISQDQERVVATGDSIDQVVASAKKNGESRPFIIRVPEENSAVIL